MKIYELIEALKPSQYRQYVKGWDKSKYDALFGGKYRIELPGAHKAEPDADVQPDYAVRHALAMSGYEIADYTAGLATKNGRQIKIGKVLSDGNYAAALQRFANDPARAASKLTNLKIVISRHPYDIAGMSTNRGWTSCMNLKDGSNKSYVAVDVKEGTLIAYLVNEDDTNIKNPIARVLIKPFYNTATPSKQTQPALGVSTEVYGTAPTWFPKEVAKWADAINASNKLAGLFSLSPSHYNDGEPVKQIGDVEPESIAEYINQHASTADMRNLFAQGMVTDEVLMYAYSAETVTTLIDIMAEARVPISSKVQTYWVSVEGQDVGDIIQGLFDRAISPDPAAVLAACRKDGRVMRILHTEQYWGITKAMVEAATESLLDREYSDNISTDADRACDLIDAFRTCRLAIPDFVLGEIKANKEAYEYYTKTTGRL